jgi:hypothetical protein
MRSDLLPYRSFSLAALIRPLDGWVSASRHGGSVGFSASFANKMSDALSFF